MECNRRELLTGRFARSTKSAPAGASAAPARIEVGSLPAFPIGAEVPVNGARQLVIADACGLRAIDTDSSASAMEPVTRPLSINSRGQVCLDISRTCPPSAYLNVMTGELCYAQEEEL